MRCTGPNPIKLSTLHRFPAFLFNKNTYCMEFPSSLHSCGGHTSGGIEMDGSTAKKIFSMSALEFGLLARSLSYHSVVISLHSGLESEGICEKVFSNACAALSSDLFPQLHTTG